MHWRGRSLLGRARLAWAAAGVGPPGSCLRTSCKCYRFLPINADLIKRSPGAGPEHCVPAFSVSLQNTTPTGLLSHPWEGDTAKNLGPFHLRSDVPLSLSFVWAEGGPWLLCPSPSLLPASQPTLALGSVSASQQCPAEPPGPRSQAPFPWELAHRTVSVYSRVPSHPLLSLNKGKANCILEQLLHLQRPAGS